MTDEQSVQPARGDLPTTHWSCVAEAADLESPGTKDALTPLCLSVWYPALSLFVAGDMVPMTQATSYKDSTRTCSRGACRPRPILRRGGFVPT
jgi:hypothetical protein